MDWSLFDAAERALLLEALPRAGGARATIDRQLARLERLAALTRHEEDELGPDALLERFAGLRYDVDLRLPAAAAVARAFLLHKVDLLREVTGALAAGGDGDADADALRARAEAELAQSIHSHLVEELFVAVAADAGNDTAVRREAARKVILLWRAPLAIEIDDIAPLLDAIWEARRRMRPVLGTLLGTHEIFTLFRSTRDERFLEHFAAGELPDEEIQAYREFLFGLSTEEHDALRRAMDARGAECVSLAEARELLGLGPPRPAEHGPDAMVASYRARKIKASYRALVGAPGPRRTAEEHVVIARLARGDAL
jgi:hypothetical protein